MKGETIEITRKDAKAILEVLEKGMPDSQKKRDKLAQIWYGLDYFAETGKV